MMMLRNLFQRFRPAAALPILAGILLAACNEEAAYDREAALCRDNAAETEALRTVAAAKMPGLLVLDEPRDLRNLQFAFAANGQSFRLGDFAGKALLFNLWATWCAPCREEMPALDRLQKTRGGEDFAVLTVNIDAGSDERARAFLEENRIEALPLYREPGMKLFNELKGKGLAFGMPTTLLIDDKGCALAAFHGAAEWDSQEALAVIDEVVKEK